MITRACKATVALTTCSSNPLRTLTRFTSSWSSISAKAAAPSPPSDSGDGNGGSEVYQQSQRFTSSWSSISAKAAAPSPPSDSGDGNGGSEVYQQSRKIARPMAMKCSERLWNSVSLIGSVEYPVKKVTSNGKVGTSNGRVGAYTFLLVKPSPHSHRHFRVTLSMWGSLAERALAHLKQNDYIYVSGQLGSYTKSTLDGAERTYYKVTANELNYVQVPDENYLVAAKAGSEADTRETGEQRNINRLHLWQILFANPDEWYDNRETKRSSAHPDFKHKSTGEGLWLCASDPPWVKKQVELLGCRLSRPHSDDSPFGSFASGWVSNDRFSSSDSLESSTISDDYYDK